MPLAPETRANPDALLAEAERETRGRLKVYLGMAPGVGKTYAMLAGARRLKAQGLDVVAGVIETHGRAETMALVEGLEVLPRRSVAYRNQTLDEFDIDAALARRPVLLLVDELAHTNAPESRHPKRWQDVEELIRAGIDVHTTLNVQHLESLTDVVARITGVRVSETIPDGVLEQADEIELVDLPPQDLLARLAEGKVYAPHLAGRAREAFFKPGNLTALRELALRMAAHTVDGQLVGYMRAHAIDGPWPAGERIMALVGPDGLGAAVVRAANRIADQLKAPFLAVTIEPQGRLSNPAADARIAEALTLAERLGGRVERLSSADLVGEILAYARRMNVTQIFIGRARALWWREVLRRSLVAELIRRADGVAIHVVNERPEKAPVIKNPPTMVRRIAVQGYGEGVLAVALVTGAATVMRNVADGADVAMLFLVAVLISAVRSGTGPAVATSAAGFLAYNFFFTEPLNTFAVTNWADIVTLAVFVLVAATTGTLAARLRNQALAERARMTALQALYDFSRRLGAKVTIDELCHAIVLQLHRLTGRPAVLLLPEGDDVRVRYAWPPEDDLPARDLAAARWARDHGEPAGVGTCTMPTAAWHFRPLRTAARTLGVLGIASERAPHSEEAQTIDAVLDQGAVALERISFASDAARVEAMSQTEKLRAALLSSVSHDLRTPLTAILGAATGLRRDGERITDDDRRSLLDTIEDEARRLDRFVNNLLEMTRLEGGALKPRLEWIDLQDAVEGAIAAVRKTKSSLIVSRAFPDALPPVAADLVLLDSVLVNVLDNVGKHGGERVRISATIDGQTVRLVLEDDGPGIAPDLLPHVFDRFTRAPDMGAAPGAGLGLSICKGLVEAMGGTVWAESPLSVGRGARITLVLPAGQAPVDEPELA
jgi:two-component system, OmpR family, sensor histidine kinase KdpD